MLARNPRWQPPEYLRNGLASPIASDRMTALDGLKRLNRVGNDLVRARTAEEIRRLADDSRTVSAAAVTWAAEAEARTGVAAPDRVAVEPAPVPELAPEGAAAEAGPRITPEVAPGPGRVAAEAERRIASEPTVAGSVPLFAPGSKPERVAAEAERRIVPEPAVAEPEPRIPPGPPRGAQAAPAASAGEPSPRPKPVRAGPSPRRAAGWRDEPFADPKVYFIEAGVLASMLVVVLVGGIANNWIFLLRRPQTTKDSTASAANETPP
ncbi:MULTISPECIES: hypothetical protein [unclassified Amycolatopsis]|uniref:hypothetical protein n=1 Tax=unclassified Amycolatopsis TaxID=2618356 RepID=UPI002875E090|nr:MULTISPECIES: hypothetical protein [unclassified Amycolatopsis]MDS0139340.1 hypothetical protein [Amycolatopsis sp. 505]MDS0144572.1 hypothetical protein [Amycolatopsis sp. CM201R]